MRTGLFLLLAIAATFVAIPQLARACVFVPISQIDGNGRPASVDTPRERAAWQRRQEALAESERQQRVRRDAQAFAHYLDRLAEEADRAPEISAADLASALVESLVPPVVRQLVPKSDCGYEWNGIVTDEAGYLMDERAYPEAAGLPAENSEAMPGYDLGLRRHMSAYQECLPESRAILSQLLVSQFSQPELAHVWSYVHRLGFDRTANEWGNLEPLRLLAFPAGSGGPLRLAQDPPMNNWSYDYSLGQTDAATIRSLQQGAANPPYWQALAGFLQSDPVARRQIVTLDGALAGGTAAFCPDAHARMANAATMMTMSLEEWRVWRRTAPPIAQD